MLDGKAIGLELVLADGDSFVLKEAQEEGEEMVVVAPGAVEDVEVLLGNEGELGACHFLQNHRLGKRIDEKLFSVGVEGEVLGEHLHLVEEQQAVLVVALAAVAQHLEAQVHYLFHQLSLQGDVFLVAQQLR